MNELLVVLVRALAIFSLVGFFGVMFAEVARSIRDIRRANRTRGYLAQSGAQVMRSARCRYEGAWWWLAWGTKWAWRRVDLWLTAEGVVMASGRTRDGSFAHYAREGATVIPGPPLRRAVVKAELLGDEVHLHFNGDHAPHTAAFVVSGLSGPEREALCAIYSGATRVAPLAPDRSVGEPAWLAREEDRSRRRA